MVLRPSFTLEPSRRSLKNTQAQALLPETGLQLVPVGPMQCRFGKPCGGRFCSAARTGVGVGGGRCKDPPPVHSRLFVYWVGYIRPAGVRASERGALSALAVIQRDPEILRTGGGEMQSLPRNRPVFSGPSRTEALTVIKGWHSSSSSLKPGPHCFFHGCPRRY